MTTLQLSEAIRLGAMLKPQAFGAVVKNGGSCALGAALEAVGACKSAADGWAEEVFDRWPIACRTVDYPGVNFGGDRRVLLGSACWILNDADNWTREQIADWVETIEAQAEAEQAQAASGPVTPVSV